MARGAPEGTVQVEQQVLLGMYSEEAYQEFDASVLPEPVVIVVVEFVA